MSVAVLAAGAAGALAAGALADVSPDLARTLRALVRRLRVRTAGNDGGASVGRIVGGSVALGLALLVVGLPTLGLLVGGGPAVLRSVGRARAGRRRRAVAQGAPLVARAIADALDGGHGVRRAIGEASRASGLDGPAASELRAVAARLQAGDPLAAALDAWAVRTDEPAHRTIVAGLLLHGEAGGELADVLRDQAAAIERSRRATAEAESAIVQARAAARIVGGIPAVSMGGAVLLAPDAVRQITSSPLGALLVVAAVLLQAVATVAVRRLTTGLGR